VCVCGFFTTFPPKIVINGTRLSSLNVINYRKLFLVVPSFEIRYGKERECEWGYLMALGTNLIAASSFLLLLFALLTYQLTYNVNTPTHEYGMCTHLKSVGVHMKRTGRGRNALELDLF
jgi:hypothetical protein